MNKGSVLSAVSAMMLMAGALSAQANFTATLDESQGVGEGQGVKAFGKHEQEALQPMSSEGSGVTSAVQALL